MREDRKGLCLPVVFIVDLSGPESSRVSFATGIAAERRRLDLFYRWLWSATGSGEIFLASPFPRGRSTACADTPPPMGHRACSPNGRWPRTLSVNDVRNPICVGCVGGSGAKQRSLDPIAHQYIGVPADHLAYFRWRCGQELNHEMRI